MSTKQQVYIKTRIDPEVKKASDHILHQLGLTTPEAIRLFLAQVILRGGLPFRVELQSPAYENEDILLPADMRQAALDIVYGD